MEDFIKSFLVHIGENPSREGLLQTPQRVVKSWEHLFSGYKQNPEDLFTVFKNEDNYDEMVILKNIEMHSTCEHHLLNFSGRAHVAYIPNEKIVGVSKLARLVDMYSRRLQIQERLCKQVTDTLMEYLKPKGAGCIIEAKHSCVSGESKVQLAYLDRSKYPDGIPIKKLVGKQNLPIYCYDDKLQQVVVGNARNVWWAGKKKVYKITYEWYCNNQHKKIRREGCIKATEDHLFMLRKKSYNHYNNKNRVYENGFYLSLEGGLSIGDSLMPFSCYGIKYKNISLNNGKVEAEHRFLLENKIGRKLTTIEIAHHVNNNSLDNTEKNLELFSSRGKHSKKHLIGVKRPHGYPAWNRKERSILICLNCEVEFTTQFKYMEKNRKFCSHACALEMRYANHKIINIEEIGIEDVYDLEVDKHHNFAVNDIIVHNCMMCRGVENQHSSMITSSLEGVFKENSLARSEFLSLIKN